MSKNDEKFLSVDKFREKVYSNVGFLESMDEENMKQSLSAKNPGCFGLFNPLILSLVRKSRKDLKVQELSDKADEILADKEIKNLLCEKLDATINLPIDAAYKITPVLYGVALEDEEKVPFNTMLFAIISRKIVKRGVENFCAVE